MLEKLVSPVFDYIANSFVDAFVKRAEEMLEKIKAPFAEMALFENAGAPVYKEDPAQAYAVVNDFLKRLT